MNEQWNPGEAELRMALHGLRQDCVPTRELWPGIAARLSPQQATVRAPTPWSPAVAASILLLFCFALPMEPRQSRPVMVAEPMAAAIATSKEAEAMTIHYRAALREIGGEAAADAWQPGLEALDRSAEQVLVALRQRPQSTQLLEQLRQIYARRIALSRRAVLS